jgi:nucleotide-binding universal stress UspA family protein
MPVYKRILVTTDGSALSRRAVTRAVGLASALGSELVALHVVPKFPMSYMDGEIALTRKQADIVEKRWAERGQRLVEEARKEAASKGVEARGVVLQSNAVADTVVAAARKEKCDLIVMASHGRSGIKRVLLGSETQHVLARTKIATLVVR